MKTKIFLNLALVLSLILGMGIIYPVQAQTVVYDMSPSGLQDMDQLAGVINFSQLRETNIMLNGPYDSSSLLFGLPPSWKILPGSQIDLSITVSINTPISAEVTRVFGGILIVRLNKTNLIEIPLNETGNVNINLSVPVDAFLTTRSDGRSELRFTLDGGLNCSTEQKVSVAINGESRLNLEHDLIIPSVDLANFPRPLYQTSIFSDQALIVVPDQPDRSELQSALIVSAGLGSIAGSHLSVDINTLTNLTKEQQESNHLIYVGKSSSFSLLSEFSLPLSIVSNKFEPLSNSEAGVIQMINSPWSSTHIVLIVSGNTDEGVIKAAQAVSTGTLRSSGVSNLAIVEDVQESLIEPSISIDQTLGDLGYQKEILNNRGVNVVSYEFNFPAGNVVSSDAFFEIQFAHSELLDFTRSGMTIFLNDQPVGSVNLNETTAEQTGSMRIPLPPSMVIPGRNKLDVRVSLIPQNECIDPNLESLWANILPESRLYLPLSPVQTGLLPPADLNQFPAPFAFDTRMLSSAFVIPQNDLPAWRTAFRIAYYLGYRMNSDLVAPSLFFGDDFNIADRSKYNLIIVGRPTQLPILTEINQLLPAPFNKNSNLAIEDNLQVSFQVNPDASLGYMQLIESPWNEKNVILMVLGSTEEGVAWAGNALLDSNLQSQLSGNLAIINNLQVVSTDTRSAINVDLAPAQDQNVQQEFDTTPPLQARESWILPAMLASTVLMLGMIVTVFFMWRASNRGSKVANKEPSAD